MASGLIRQTGEAGDQTCDPCFTRQAVYPIHHSCSPDNNDLGPIDIMGLDERKPVFGVSGQVSLNTKTI